MKKTIIIVVVLVVVVGSLIGFANYRRNQNSQSELAGLQTVIAEKGSLIASVGATGTVRANQTALLNWNASGIVGEVFTYVGTDVNKNDVLAEIVETSLSQNVIMAQSELINAEKALENIGDAFDTLALAQALDLIAGYEKSVNDAEQTLYSAETPVSQNAIDQAESTLILAEERVTKAQADWDRWEDSRNNTIIATMQGNLASAKSAFSSAQYRYNILIGDPNQITIDNAQADLDLAEVLLENAKAEYERLLTGPTDSDQTILESRVEAAQATLNTAFIAAPFSGTVTLAIPKPGDLVNVGTSAFRIDDLDRLLVDVEISEVDINRIKKGQSVILTFDAILATEYQGEVAEVSLVGMSNQGLVTFDVIIELLEVDEQVKPGMTSGVNIVVSQLDDALLIPNRAVRVEDGERVIYILNDDNEIEMINISLGLSSDTHSQVLGGDLKEGDEIILNPSTNFFSGPGGDDGPFGRMFGGN